MSDEQALFSGLLVFTLLLLVVLLRRVIGKALVIALRTAAGGGILALLAPFEEYLGFHLGVNLWNALVIGVLGMPGLGLLLLLQWLVR